MSVTSQTPSPWFYQKWPEPANQSHAKLFLDALQEQWKTKELNTSFLQNPHALNLIHTIGGNSPYLTDLILKDIHFFEFLLQNGPEKACETTFNNLHNFTIQESRTNIAKILRLTKQKIALACAVADIGNLWSLEKITETLSNLAETTLHLAINHLLLQAHQNKKIFLPDPDNPQQDCGLIILGMGKLGGKELNYSSDIDLIILYDPDRYPDNPDLSTLFIRITRQLVSLMEDRDENGYVFRVDLRLRPDPSSSPLAVSLPAAISYYESLGQTWERSAMSKARPVAGDLVAGQAFLEAIQPFIWRKHLDFAVIDDIHAMKNRIDHYKNKNQRDFPPFPEKIPDQEALRCLIGHNVKLGHGGIREIEFMPQTFQLIWGGRFPRLRIPQTVAAIEQLAQKKLLSADSALTLIKAYSLLRKTEHRLQMQCDYQTHSLPDSEAFFRQFTLFMGYETAEAFVRELFPLMQQVRQIFESFFSTPENEESYILDLPLTELEAYLNKKGFPPDAAIILQSWNNSGPRSLRTARARSILKNILPTLLQVFSEQKKPLLILQRFDSMLARHHAGIQLLSLFEHNPVLINRLASMLGISQFMADYISDNPAALDAMINVDILKTKTDLLQKTIHQHLISTHPLEEILPTLHSLIKSEEFRISFAYIEGRLSLNKGQILRTQMADLILQELLIRVTKEHEQKYGIIPDGDITIVILGKAGSWEMNVGSDLDMMLIFDHPPEITSSIIPDNPSNPSYLSIPVSPRPLNANAYYIRLTQSFITAITNTSHTGPLYEIDMRLRPSGNKGPVAVSLDSFRNYHQNSAWTWERMALTCARVIGGSKVLQERVNNAIQETLSFNSRHQKNTDVIQDAIHMRQRLEKEIPPTSLWDIKYLKGGLIEVEFIAQTLQLVAHNRQVRHPCTRIAFRKLAQYGYLRPEDAQTLIHADHFWRDLQTLLRLFFGKNPPQDLEKEVTPTILKVITRNLLKETPQTSHPLSILEAKIKQISEEVRSLFIKLLGPIS